jgi:hypothetical protein
MADNSENILVEFDYNNITIIDPNKVIDENGNAKERYVSQEDLVMYANLECKPIPRTKLAVGSNNDDIIRNTSIASINFLKPGGKRILENDYTDNLTGQENLKSENKINSKDEEYYAKQTNLSGGNNGTVDSGLLGITSISIQQNTSFTPVITIELEDVKGRALFESGNNSPYAAFFNMPYPIFYLTIKGYYGKAVRLPLMLQSFNSRYNTSSGNFHITLSMITYKYNVLNEVTMAAAIATPQMYQKNIDIKGVEGGPSQFANISSVSVSLGKQKMHEMYSEYKTKGLIPDDFPEITILQMYYRLENFIKNTLESYIQQNLDPLNNVQEYEKKLREYQGNIATYQKSWKDKYMDNENFYVSNLSGEKLYSFKKEFDEQSKREVALAELKKYITEYNEILNKNETVGTNGSYEINGNLEKCAIPNNITFDIFLEIIDKPEDVNLQKTLNQRSSKKKFTNDEISKLQAELNTNMTFNSGKIIMKDGGIVPEYTYYKFGDLNEEQSPVPLFRTFLGEINRMFKDVKSYREKIQDALTKALTEKIQSKDNGIGFVPTIRNVLSVIFANGEAFLRIMDDVHAKAWEVRDDTDRKKAILDPSVSNANPDNLSSGDNTNLPIYPWPQYIVETAGENGQEKYIVAYPGDPKYSNLTNATSYEKWPEVEFVEEFINAFVNRNPEIDNPEPVSNEQTDINRLSFNAIEFPVENIVYGNKEEVKFFFEIYERLFYTIYYSRLSRAKSLTQEKDFVSSIIAEAEKTNLLYALGTDNPFLIEKIKQYGINSSNFETTLRHISNGGTGQSWQNFIRGIFNTNYIRNTVQNSQFEFLNLDKILETKSNPLLSLEKEDEFLNYITGSSSSNSYDYSDIYPLTNLSWCKDKLANGQSISDNKAAFNTTKILTYNKSNKTITNFPYNLSTLEKRPITNFIYENTAVPTADTTTNLVDFYNERVRSEQLVTEGDLIYYNYSGQVGFYQTTSMLNTPFYVNSIQQAVEKFRNYDDYPYTVPAYLFLNSLPLSTLREKYKTYKTSDSNITVEDLDYILASLKKFGAIHKVPYAWILKIGSIYHRYKKYVENNIDILDDCWQNFKQVENFDPITNVPTRNYGLIINGANIDIVLEKDTIIGTETSTLINTGFYPKLINDFNVFYQGYMIYSTFTDTDIQNGFDSGVTLNYVSEAIINEPEGFDDANPMRDLRVIPWSVNVDNIIKTFTYPIPSQGSLLNQTFNECFTKEGNIDKLKLEVKGNQAMYDGSIRNFWAAPHYGYFDLSKIKKPEYDEYIKIIFTESDVSSQENFGLHNPVVGYSKISEIFSAFDTEILNKFEEEFLNFSKSVYDYDLKNLSETLTKTEKSFKNFQFLMREMMKVPKQSTTGATGTEAVSRTQEIQCQTINSYIKEFLNFDYVFKYGNPSSFDKKLFYSFSNKFIEDPYTWEKYTEATPDALPVQGGSVTLTTSQTNFPEEWKTLRIYVGFSDIPELTYKDSGSFITDFFIDLNVGFNVQNIKNFAPIIKIYATQKLTQTQPQTSVSPLPIPPVLPTQQFVGLIIEIFTLNDGSTVTIYKQNENKFSLFRNFSQEIKFVGEQVGISGETNLNLAKIAITEIYGFYSQSPLDPQYIASVTTPPEPQFPLVPSSTNNWGKVTFINNMDNYLSAVDRFQGTIVDNLMITLRSKLPLITVENSKGVRKDLDGSQTKLELWESFKATNDKWISGGDFKNKTIFEDLLLLDRASRNIGDTVIADIFHLKNFIMDASPKMSVLSFAQSVLLRNNFMVMNIPSYVNFYNVQDAVKNPKPRPEGTLEFANTLFGTFLNVDYRDSSSKMVCFFISKPSEHLAINKNVDYRFKDDAFDLRKTSNPLVENQVGKTDWDKSNKVVGFNVDIGTQNQQIFQSFDVSQEAGTSTAESLEVINQMANQSGNRGGATQNLSLYNIYKNRSYKCKIMMMGNAMIQPSMYFNLRYVPMFSGPYMILDVTHNIVPGMFHTTITGIRQPTASLPKVDQFVQTIRTNLLKIIKDKLKVESSSNTPQVAQSTQNVTNTNAAAGTSNSVTSPTLTTGPTSNTTTNSIDQLRLLNYELNNSPASTKSANQECVSNSDYASYTKAEIVKKEFNLTQMYEIVNSVLNLNGGANIKLAHTIYAFIWLNSNGSAAGFSSNNFNFGGIDLTSSWGQSGESNFLKEYFCSTDNVPYASFQNTDKFVTFLSNRWRSRVATISEDNYKEITKFIILNSKQNIKPETIYEDMDIVDLGNIESQVQSAIFAYDQVNRQSATSTEPTQLLSITRTSVGDPKFVVTVNNTNNEKWVMIVAEYKVTSPSECSQTDYQYNISNLISSDKQSLSISLEDIQLDSDCSDTPVESVKFRVTLNPVLSDGVTLDNSRSQTVQYISGNF